MDIEKLLVEFNTIAEHRNWRHLHTPKNLATALAVEAGELLRLFQWLPEDPQSQQHQLAVHRTEIANEIADVVAYATVLADKLNIDVATAIERKMAANKERFLSNSIDS